MVLPSTPEIVVDGFAIDTPNDNVLVTKISERCSSFAVFYYLCSGKSHCDTWRHLSKEFFFAFGLHRH